MMIKNVTELGALVKRKRIEKELSQKALADMIGASRFWIGALEKGKPRAEIGLIIAVLEALNLRVDIDESDHDEESDYLSKYFGETGQNR